MVYVAHVVQVMIAFPSDAQEARAAVERALHGWNDAYARNRQVILQPWWWEAAVPSLGDHPQALLNAQGVDQADVVFALFGSRLGSPTPAAVSGTVEEIERADAQGKPVHLYFSTEPLPHDVDLDQVEGLRAFKREIQARSLYGEFSNPSHLEHEVWKAIEHDLTGFAFGAPASPQAPSGVHFIVQPKSEREPQGIDKRGKQQYRTRTWLEITNDGTTDAHDVRFEVPEDTAGLRVHTDGTAVIHAGQTRRITTMYMMGSSADPVVRISWTEDGEPREKNFHVG
jgi:hypothetical protein